MTYIFKILSKVKSINILCIAVLSYLLPGAKLTSAFTQNDLSTDTLAVIGNQVITTEKYVSSYKNQLLKLGLTDNLDTRKGFLLNLIQDELLIQEAKETGLDKSVDAQNEIKRIQLQELLNAYSDKHISTKINISESDLEDLFIKMNTKIKIRHLYAADKEEADHLYNELMNGKTFDELARNIFQDSKLKDTGGLIGYITIDEMDPDFEKMAYSLKVGEISKPVKTVQGYSIIKVEDLIRSPFVTQGEFLKAHDKIKAFARKRAYEELAKQCSHSLSSQLNIQFNEKSFSLLFETISQKSINSLKDESGETFQDNIKKAIVTSSIGDWDLQTIFNEINNTSEKQKKWIHTKENLIDFITGLINRKFITQKAQEENLDKLPSCKKNVESNFNIYLLSTLENKILGNIKISEDSIKTFYMHNSKLFASEPEIRLSSILLDRKTISDSVTKLLESGADFGLLAKKYSIQKIPAERGGDIGYYKKAELENFGQDIFTLKKDQWTGPLFLDGKFLFVKCTHYKESVLKSFEESAPEIERWLVNSKWYEMKEDYVNSLKDKIDCKIFADKLIKIKI